MCCFYRGFLEGLINPLQEQMEEWKRGVNTLDKDHAKGGMNKKKSSNHCGKGSIGNLLALFILY